MHKKILTGYPSIDKLWTKYYSEEAKNPTFPECSLYEYLYENNKDYINDYAINYFGKKITYGKLFSMIEEVLGKCDGVTNSCVVGMTQGENQVLKAVVAIDEANIDQKKVEKSLRSICEKELPRHARPTYYEFVDELPLTGAGKVDYRKLENDL